ncbi:MAG: AAA family ATPase [Okeania sp. SIO3C4]|nr:AAA family ATPase [Okeania sp. SIO3C4]
MVLKLRSIRLKNWKCYQNQEIKFNLNTDKQIWIVFGQNGFGKTSILEAIQWCLYGAKAISDSKLLDHFNRVIVKQNPNLEMSVELVFERNGDIYNISRVAKREIQGETVRAKVELPVINKNGKNIRDVPEKIEELLPNSCKEFFFFDGVEIKRYAQRIHTKETHKAIERILGITELLNLRHDVEITRKKLDQKFNEADSANESLKQVKQKLREIQENIEVKTAQLQEAESAYEQAMIDLKETREEANKIEALQQKLEQLKDLEREQERCKENLKKATEKLENGLRQAAIPLLIEFVREVADDMQSIAITTARRSGSVKLLRELLEDKTCVCGRCIDEDSRQFIIKEIKSLESSVSSTQEVIRQDELRNRLETISDYKIPNFEDLLLERDCLQDELETIKLDAYRLKRETKGINQEEAQAIWQTVGEAEQITRQKKEQIDRLNKEIEDLKKDEEKQRREIEKLATQDKQTATLAKQAKLARNLYQATDELIKWRTEERKQTIEDKTSKIHRQVTNKPEEYQGIKIQTDYTLGVKNAVGKIIDPETLSAGEKEALAFAFITGLNLASGTAAPLIMDTPFGHLDTKHQKNLITSLPEIPSQVIVLATDRDFPPDLLNIVQPHIAGTLNIRRLGATKDASVVEEKE